MTRIWNGTVEDGHAFPQEDPLGDDTAPAFFDQQDACGVAVVDGRIVGLYILHPNNVGRCGHICNASYCVDRNERNHGAGKALVMHSLETARNLGYRIMQFNAVVADNLPAIEVYRKCGFQTIGTVPGGFRNVDGEYKDITLFYHSL
ncbi:MAG: GNAT family N-acetyltransferase [Candidatus Methanomethylophilaceae archaeon]|nr:GNAT family N-acetyltransferase [Candidatus Methanomethylophilaceae archaeon]